MPHALLVVDLFLVGLAALAGGWICRRLGMPEVLGYLAAGILLGPSIHTGSSFVDQDTIRAIGQFAVLFRMFTLGLDFDAKRLRGRWKPALASGFLGMALCLPAGIVLSHFMGWSVLEGAVIGAALGTTSTNILSKALADRGMTGREDARAAGAATLAEDLISMSLIAILTVFAGAQGVQEIVEQSLGLAVFASLAFTAGAILVPLALDKLGRSSNEELATLAVLAVLFGFAGLSVALLHAGPAIGAFLAGVAVAAARFAPGVAARVLPLRDILAAAAYVSLGLFLAPSTILQVAPYALVLSLVFVALKTMGVAVGLRIGGVSAPTAARAGAILGQCGTMGLVFVCGSFLPAEHFGELLAFAFVSWAFTVALTPLRLRYGPDFAERIARAFGASDAHARSGKLHHHIDAETRREWGLVARAAASAAALGALVGLLVRTAPYLSLAIIGGVLAGAAILPFAIAAAMATRRAAKRRGHQAAMRPSRLSKGRVDRSRSFANVATLVALAFSIGVPLLFAAALVPGMLGLVLVLSAAVGGGALFVRKDLPERLSAEVEKLTARQNDVDVRLQDFRGVSPFGFEVIAVHVRPGTTAEWATLRNLKIPELTRARVVAVLRQGTRDGIPVTADTVLHPGDEVVLGGSPASIVEARRLLLSAAVVNDDAAKNGQVDGKAGDVRGPRVA